jgi:prepilin-type N-terminal cleavage/methylation domain-containing protein
MCSSFRHFAASRRVGRAGRTSDDWLARSARGADGPPASSSGFTIIEILVVLAIILVLAGLILATSGFVQKKGARSRAEVEIVAMSAALENYKADNGIYPGSILDPATTAPSSYQDASTTLYESLAGDPDGDGQPDPAIASYMQFKPNQLGSNNSKMFVKDPFGNSYGYSTLHETNPAKGFNPTFDLWSTAGSGTESGKTGWIKNW